jgi:hypothetical protein
VNFLPDFSSQTLDMLRQYDPRELNNTERVPAESLMGALFNEIDSGRATWPSQAQTKKLASMALERFVYTPALRIGGVSRVLFALSKDPAVLAETIIPSLGPLVKTLKGAYDEFYLSLKTDEITVGDGTRMFTQAVSQGCKQRDQAGSFPMKGDFSNALEIEIWTQFTDECAPLIRIVEAAQQCGLGDQALRRTVIKELAGHGAVHLAAHVIRNEASFAPRFFEPSPDFFEIIDWVPRLHHLADNMWAALALEFGLKRCSCPVNYVSLPRVLPFNLVQDAWLSQIKDTPVSDPVHLARGCQESLKSKGALLLNQDLPLDD